MNKAIKSITLAVCLTGLMLPIKSWAITASESARYIFSSCVGVAFALASLPQTRMAKALISNEIVLIVFNGMYEQVPVSSRCETAANVLAFAQVAVGLAQSDDEARAEAQERLIADAY